MYFVLDNPKLLHILQIIFYIKYEKFMIEKIEAIHLIKTYGGEGRKYPEVPRIMYMVFPKCGTKYKK